MRNAKHLLSGWLICMVVLNNCQNRGTTQELLDGNFISSGQSIIDLLSPTENQQVATANPKFSWSSKGVGKYTIQIATDAAFSNLVLDKDVTTNSYSLANSDLKNISSLSTNTYYWRVRIAQITNNLLSKTGSFYLVAIPSGGSGYAGILYVDAGSSSTEQNGSRAFPFKKINAAINSADSLRNGNKNIAFDIYVAGGIGKTYSESISLIPGISLLGGYNSTNNWSRSITGNVTTISAITDKIVVGGSDITTAYTSTTKIEGFTLQTTFSQASATLYAFWLDTSSPYIASNTVNITSVGNNGSVYCVYGASASPTIIKNSFRVNLSASAGSANCIYLTNSTSRIEANLILVAGLGIGYDSKAVDLGAYSGTMTQNIIAVIDSDMTSSTINLNSGTATVTNNTFYGGGGPANNIFHLLYSTTSTISNNIFFGQTGTSGYLFKETDANSDPLVFTNNLLLDSPSATVMYVNEGASNLNTIGTMCTSLMPQTPTCSGLVTGTTATAFDTGFINPMTMTSAAQLKLLAVKPGGVADIAGASGWSAGDIGADAANAGP